MNRQTITSHESDCSCQDCVFGKRNRFFRGKNMKAGEFRIEQDYGIGHRRLLSRAIAGWGVVYGLAVEGPSLSSESDRLKVARGLALDRHGREAVVVTSLTLAMDNTCLIETGAGGCQVRSIDHIRPGKYLLAIHYAERLLGDAALPDDCGCAIAEKNFVCETVVFSLTSICEGECPCGEPCCERECSCCGHGCCAERGRGPHACLCQWVAAASIPKCADKLCQWRGYALDPNDGIGLACVEIAQVGDECCPTISGWVMDDCTPRRIVKNNDLLYDLIRGCDLTRIKSVSWGYWHRREEAAPWHVFLTMLGAVHPGEADHTTALSVTFTGPVKTATVTPDCFDVTFTVSGEDTGWFERREVAITRVKTTAPNYGDPPDTTRMATLCVDVGWYEEVTSRASKFRREGAVVEIEVNGDFILDCHGQAIDANAHGFALQDAGDGSRVMPSGNGTPGGALVSVFRIGAHIVDRTASA